MYNENLYNEKLYNEIVYIPSEYTKANSGINFGNGIFYPNKNNCAINIKYLDARSVSYNTSRVTDHTLKTYNIQQIKGVVEITGVLEGENRLEILEESQKMKDNIYGNIEATIKDSGKEFINDYVVSKITFDDNHYNNTWLDFKIILEYHENKREVKTSVLTYKNITENNKNFIFDTLGKETDFTAVFEINSGNNLYDFKLNDISIFEDNLIAGDIITINSKLVTINKNGIELVFSGILDKLKEKENIINISDSSGSRDYNLSVKYKKSFN